LINSSVMEMQLDSQPQSAPETPLANPDLAALIGRIARKEPAALIALYNATSRVLFGMALRILGDRAAAEEVLLDVYTQVWKQSASYDDKRCTPISWITAITRNRAIDKLRSGRREWKPQADEKVGAGKHASGKEEGLPAMSMPKGPIQSAIETLPSEQWSVIELAYYWGFSQTEIAARLHQPLGAVRTRARLGMIKLSELLHPILQPMEMDKRGMGH
jgi:RNA polymerase sigma-70 factor (ECF subfamily)